jgi:predicted aldo/keto reductase-like oxidoreductase
MNYRKLGNTGLKVPEVSLGCMAEKLEMSCRLPDLGRTA